MLRQRLQLVAFGAYQLEHVGILLVGHDAAACGTLLRELDEREVLAVKHAGIECHLGHRAGYRRHGKCHVALCLAAPHLSVHHVIVHRVEAQQLGCHGAVERERRAVAGSAAQRIAVGHAPCSLKEEHVVGKALGIGVATPATLPNIAIVHDTLGKPVFDYAPPLADYLAERRLTAHLSISDETEYAVAFVVLESH